MTEDKEEVTAMNKTNDATSEDTADNNSDSDSKAAINRVSESDSAFTAASSQGTQETTLTDTDNSQATSTATNSSSNVYYDNDGDGSDITGTDCYNRKLDKFLEYPCWKQILMVSVSVSSVSFILCFAVALLLPTTLTPSSYPFALQDAYLFYAGNLDMNVDPCEDFHAYVCRRTIYRLQDENRNDFDTKKELQENAWKSLVKLLSLPASTSDSRILSEVKVFYKSCTNEDQIQKEGVESLRKLLDNVGGWPLLKKQEDENSYANDENWEEVVGRINKAGIANFFPFQLYFDPHPHNASKLSMSLYPYLWDQKPEEMLSADNSTADYYKNLSSTLQGSNEIHKYDFDRCVNFETTLHQMSNSGEINFTYCSVADLPTRFPGINWTLFFKNIFVESGLELAETDYVWFADPNYPSQIAELLETTTTSTIRNYLVFKILDDAIKMMPSNSILHTAHLRFHGKTKLQTRSFECVQLLVEKAAAPMGQLYVENFFDPRSKSAVDDICDVIIAEAQGYFREIDWIGDDARKMIIANLEKLKMVVAYVAEGKNMERFFHELAFRPNDTAFSHYRDLLNFQRSFQLSKLTNVSVEDENMLIPLHHATEADALYNPSMNTMYILAAILQQPYFDYEFIHALNLGGIGFVIAHEMTHGLDILSACRNSTLCPGRFKGLENCLINTYGDYTVRQILEMINHDRARRTLGENLGDLIALKLAYRAYYKLSHIYKELEPPLPHLKYTHGQLFWINAANGLCSYKNDTQLKNMLSDNHTPTVARINVALRNLPEFARDFNCLAGTGMTATGICDPE